MFTLEEDDFEESDAFQNGECQTLFMHCFTILYLIFVTYKAVTPEY